MMGAMAYPVTMTVQPRIANRNRLTTAFRLVLAIPHLILIGGTGQSGGLLSAAAMFLAIVSWFTIVIAARTSQESDSSRCSTCAGGCACSHISCCSRMCIRRSAISRTGYIRGGGST